MQMNEVQIFQLSLFIMAFKSLKLLGYILGWSNHTCTQLISQLFWYDNCDVQTTEVNGFQNVF